MPKTAELSEVLARVEISLRCGVPTNAGISADRFFNRLCDHCCSRRSRRPFAVRPSLHQPLVKVSASLGKGIDVDSLHSTNIDSIPSELSVILGARQLHRDLQLSPSGYVTLHNS
jgi:hypothetical protein